MTNKIMLGKNMGRSLQGKHCGHVQRLCDLKMFSDISRQSLPREAPREPHHVSVQNIEDLTKAVRKSLFAMDGLADGSDGAHRGNLKFSVRPVP